MCVNQNFPLKTCFVCICNVLKQKMNLNNKSEDIFWNLRQNESITNETIASLVINEFDSNESLNALNFDLDLPQMTDICDQQKQCLRQVLTQIRQKSKHSNEDNSTKRPQIINLFNECSFDNNFRLKEVPNEDINSFDENSETNNEVFNESIDEYSTIDLENIQQLDEEYEESNKTSDVRNRSKSSSETILSIESIESETNSVRKIDSKNNQQLDEENEESNKSLEIINESTDEYSILGSENDKQLNDKNKESNKSLVRNKVKRNLRNKTKCSSETKLRIKSIKSERNSDKDLIQKYIKPDKNGFICLYTNCGKTFTVLTYIKDHIKRHLNIKPFKCHFKGCDYNCVDSHGLNRHMSRVHRFKDDLKCNECKTSFKTKFDLNTHKLRAHQKTKETENEIKKYIKRDKNGFICLYSDCGKRFTVLTYIKDHIKRHLGIKRYKCQYKGCDHKYVTSSHLNRHISLVHQLISDLKCILCNTSFKTRFDLKTHKLRAHQKTNPFENEVQKYIKRDKKGIFCLYNDCGQQCLYINHLKRHIRRHLSIKPFKCHYNGCDYNCVDCHELKGHMNRIHRFKVDLK